MKIENNLAVLPSHDSQVLNVIPVKTLDHKVNMYFNLEPISTLDIFMLLIRGSGLGF